MVQVAMPNSPSSDHFDSECISILSNFVPRLANHTSESTCHSSANHPSGKSSQCLVKAHTTTKECFDALRLMIVYSPSCTCRATFMSIWSTLAAEDFRNVVTFDPEFMLCQMQSNPMTFSSGLLVGLSPAMA